MKHPQQDAEPWKDEIVAEVRAAREQLFAACDHDLKKLAARLRQTERAHGRVPVTYPKREPSKEPAA